MAEFGDLFDQLDPDKRRRGTQFERICKWFLEHYPVYASQFRHVWLWDDWPGRWGADTGIDLVAEDTHGRLWAIQAKAYDPAYWVTKSDVDKFLAEAGRPEISFRLLIATTNHIGPNARRTMKAQEKRSFVLDLGYLEAAEIEWPSSPSDLRAKQLPPKEPKGRWSYQADAMHAVVQGFEKVQRGQLIMACGTGKTLTALFINERLAAKRTLVLVPSLALLGQTLREWTANTKIDYLPVCSDETVTELDAAIENTSDLGFPVTTDPSEIADFLRRKSGRRVVFATYQSSPRIADAFRLGRVPSFDLAIADEAHRCAGRVSSVFSTILDSKVIKARRRLFMTATPRYFKSRMRQVASEADFEVASMDDEARFGPVLHRLSFSKAIDLKLLSPYQVVVIGVDDETYRDWAERGWFVSVDGTEVTDARSLAGQIGLLKAMRRYDLHRTITFHSRVKRAREFAQSLPDVIAWMPSRQRPRPAPWCGFASGEMPTGVRYQLLQRLRNMDDDTERGLLANARCLAEGVDVPALDGVAFIDPRRSEVDIVQAVGRAMRRGSDDKVGTIVIPVFVSNDDEPAIALADSVFEPVWDVVTALRAHDERLGTRLDDLRRELGRFGQGRRLNLPENIHFDVPSRVGAEFARAFNARLVDETTASWEFWFGLLQRFVKLNGHARVPQTFTLDGYPLGRWVDKQRARNTKGTLYPDRQRQLQELPGWTWDPKAGQWEDGFSRLENYVKTHGTADVPKGYTTDGYPLGQWVIVQRYAFDKGTLSADRARRFEEFAGWTWDPYADKWEEGFRRLQDYVDTHGDARVPRPYVVDGYKLGGWINTQRTSRSQQTLDADRARRLEELPGWTWDPYADKWEEGFRRLEQYVASHGDALVPVTYRVDGYKLGGWVQTQRISHNDASLDLDRKRRLEHVPGWTWDPRAELWEKGFRKLLEYVDTHGDARVPVSFKADGYRLGAWVNTQRTRHNNGTLDASRERRLEGVPGWTWRVAGA